jgi:hypothetical protein
MPFPKKGFSTGRPIRPSTNKVVTGLPQQVKKVKAGKSPAKFLRPPPRHSGIAPNKAAVMGMLAKIGMMNGRPPGGMPPQGGLPPLGGL